MGDQVRFLLRHDRGELGPKTIDEWATPNGPNDSLLTWMLREIADRGGRAELVQVEDGPTPDYYEVVRV